MSSTFTAYSGAPFTVTSSTTSLNAPGNPQLADQVKDDVEILGGVGPTTPYFDVTAFKPVTEARFGTARSTACAGPASEYRLEREPHARWAARRRCSSRWTSTTSSTGRRSRTRAT